MSRAPNYRHGHKPASGPCSPEWASYNNLRSRCTNPRNRQFSGYGGRGITVCDRWLNGDGQRSGFLCFVEDMGLKPSRGYQIERRNNEGNYEPGNCRWATATEQANNRRSSRIIVAFGQAQTLAVWSRIAGIALGTVHARLKKRWPPEQALSNPLQGKGPVWPYGIPHQGEWSGEIA